MVIEMEPVTQGSASFSWADPKITYSNLHAYGV